MAYGKRLLLLQYRAAILRRGRNASRIAFQEGGGRVPLGRWQRVLWRRHRAGDPVLLRQDAQPSGRPRYSEQAQGSVWHPVHN
eukprot:7253161-Prymnesium_polylepis.1